MHASSTKHARIVHSYHRRVATADANRHMPAIRPGCRATRARTTDYRRPVTRLVVLGLALLATTARATPTDAFAPSVTLDANHFTAALTYEANLAPLQIGSPTSLAPDLWYGVTPELTLGVIHSDDSIDRVPAMFEPGASICIVREQVSCPHRYHGSGLDGLYQISPGIAAHARLLLRDVDPIKPALTAGAMLRWVHGWFSVTGDPYIQLGLYNTRDGNRAQLWLPVTIAVAPIERVSLEVHTGYDTDFEVWNDGYYIPLLVRVRAHVIDQLDVGAAVGFAALAGPINNPRERIMAFDLAWRN